MVGVEYSDSVLRRRTSLKGSLSAQLVCEKPAAEIAIRESGGTEQSKVVIHGQDYAARRSIKHFALPRFAAESLRSEGPSARMDFSTIMGMRTLSLPSKRSFRRAKRKVRHRGRESSILEVFETDTSDVDIGSPGAPGKVVVRALRRRTSSATSISGSICQRAFSSERR